ncbi:MAG: Mut7-C ubiquitin/RNAse domain-containing protein [Bacteroidales bacterium]|nr:Mut7-C ubiquitin/RNAse domain-containing protein [Bacteroidales bacterium]
MPGIVTFRFYEELNQFLSKKYRKKEFEFSYMGRPSVKDAIESLGVPHTEVDMILVNGNPVDFSYRLKNNDRVAVYPVFESLDISGLQYLRKQALRNPRFVLDVHLGKLVRYLRLAGFDCFYDKSLSDAEIIRISLDEKRIILTRDKGILKNGKVSHGMFVQADDPREQFTEVTKRLQLNHLFKPFSRCTVCNEPIVKVDKDTLLDQLEPLTKKHYTVFYQCTGCKRIYWEGSHFTRMMQFISDYFGSL